MGTADLAGTVTGAMSDTDVRQGADRPPSVGGPAFDLSAAKLLRPLVRPGTIRRSSLIERLARR